MIDMEEAILFSVENIQATFRANPEQAFPIDRKIPDTVVTEAPWEVRLVLESFKTPELGDPVVDSTPIGGNPKPIILNNQIPDIGVAQTEAIDQVELEMAEGVILQDKLIQTFWGSNPEDARRVFVDCLDLVINQAFGLVGNVLENVKSFLCRVETIQAGRGANPQKSLSVLV